MTAGIESLPVEQFKLRSLVLPVYLPQFLFSVGQGALIPIIPLLAIEDLGASVALAGVIVALRGIGTIVFDVPAGVLVSRFGERSTVFFATIVLGVISVLAAHSPSVALYTVLIVLFGMASAVWHLARLTFVSAQTPTHVRGRALSLLGGTNRIGGFIGPLIGGGVALSFGLASAFYVQAILAVAGAVCMRMFVRAADDPAEQRHGSVTHQLVTVVTEHRHVFLTAGAVATVISMLRNARQAVLPLWGNAIGLDAAQIGLLFSLSSAIDMAVFYPVGMVTDRYGRKWAALPCLIAMAIGLCAIPFTDSFAELMAVGLLIGAGNGFGAGIVMTLGADFAPPRQRGEFLGVWRLIADLGQAAGPVLVAGVSAAATLGVASASAGGIGFAAAALMWFAVPDPTHRRRAVAIAATPPAHEHV